jgi:membrane protease subunit (stomatin/prohibitin family)
MFMRRRPLLRTAAVAGGAMYAGRKMGQASEERQYAEDQQNQQIAQLQQQQAYQQQQQAPAPAAAGPSMLDQLNQLSALHDQGALSDEEFAAAKAKLLG